MKPVTWPECRRVIVTELEARELSRRDLVELTGLPQTTVYGLFGGDRRDNARFGSVARLVGGLGKSLAWLERKALAGRQAKPAGRRRPAHGK